MSDSILGVSLFADVAPNDFGVFMRAFITMFRVASGDPWPESLVLVLEDGEMNWTACAYMCSFIIIACWISLEVSVAVLLENFVGASRRMEEEEKLEHIGQRKMLSEFRNPLEPLLAQLAASFVDDADLSVKLRAVFEVHRRRPPAARAGPFRLCAAVRVRRGGSTRPWGGREGRCQSIGRCPYALPCGDGGGAHASVRSAAAISVGAAQRRMPRVRRGRRAAGPQGMVTGADGRLSGDDFCRQIRRLVRAPTKEGGGL